MCQVVWRSACKRTLPNSVLIKGSAIGESHMMELSSEVGIVSCSTIHPWMEQIKGDFFSIFEAFLQPRNIFLQLLFGTIPRLWPHPSLAFLLPLHSSHRGRTLLMYLPPQPLFDTIPRLWRHPFLAPLVHIHRRIRVRTSLLHFPPPLLFSTIPQPVRHPFLVPLVRLHRRIRGCTSLLHLPPQPLFYTIPRLWPHPFLVTLVRIHSRIRG